MIYLKPTRLDARAFTYALVILLVILYVVCALFIVLAPQAAMLFYSNLIHVNLASLAPTITLSNFLIGLLGIIVVGVVSGVIFAWLYNSFTPRVKG